MTEFDTARKALEDRRRAINAAIDDSLAAIDKAEALYGGAGQAVSATPASGRKERGGKSVHSSLPSKMYALMKAHGKAMRVPDIVKGVEAAGQVFRGKTSAATQVRSTIIRAKWAVRIGPGLYDLRERTTLKGLSKEVPA